MKKLQSTVVGTVLARTAASISHSTEPVQQNAEYPFQEQAEIMNPVRFCQDENSTLEDRAILLSTPPPL